MVCINCALIQFFKQIDFITHEYTSALHCLFVETDEDNIFYFPKWMFYPILIFKKGNKLDLAP